MNAPLDELYFNWLYSQVGNVRLKNPARTHWVLLRQLHTKEFVWIVSNDDNRVEDGRELRYEFLEDEHIEDVDPEWLGLGCSTLEMLIGVSRRLSFEAEGEPRDWFAQLLDNLEIRRYNDRFYHQGDRVVHRAVDYRLENLIGRLYAYNGQGGLFPLRHPEHDQRDVEIWHQMNAFLFEREA